MKAIILATAMATVMVSALVSAPAFAGANPAEQPNAGAPKGAVSTDCNAISDSQKRSDCLKNQSQEKGNTSNQGGQQKY